MLWGSSPPLSAISMSVRGGPIVERLAVARGLVCRTMPGHGVVVDLLLALAHDALACAS
jgi:hypothetical protein